MNIDDTKKHKFRCYTTSFIEDRFGNENCARYLQGAQGSYINLGTSDILKPKKGSVSLWINIEHPMLHGMGIESNPILFTRSHEEEDHNEAYYIGYDFESKDLNVNTTISKEKQITMYTTKPFALRRWHHIVITYDNDYLTFYLNGELENKLAKNFESVFLQGDSILIGNRSSEKNRRFFNGAIDDIEIYNRVLDQAEVNELYNAPDPNRNSIILKWCLFGCLIVLIALAIIWYVRFRIRYLVKKEKERNQLIHHAMEQEIKMLKAQMDPHFIFNSLNTILQFIITQQNDKAEIYLTKFSKLIRKILESNTHETISLADELEILKKYLEIEALRFDEFIISDIHIGLDIDVQNIFIPHMMIQPFVENSIWHGLLAKKGEKILKLEFEKKDDNTLLCIIEDNGVGRTKSGLAKRIEDNVSLAINFIEQRLELMSKKYNASYSLELIDKVNEKDESLGTRVEITMPMLKKTK
jgi:two-component sensor histidine kinase